MGADTGIPTIVGPGGTFSFDGACAGHTGKCMRGMKTFSLGVFPLIPTEDGKRMKRGKVVYRVKGSAYDPDSTFKLARQVAEHLAEGGHMKAKSVTLTNYPRHIEELVDE